MYLHVAILTMMCGLAAIDLCFDSLLLTNNDSDLLTIRGYYGRTRATPLVQILTALIVCAAVSLIRVLYLRRARRDILSFLFLLALLPYFTFVMEPVEDACVAPLPAAVPASSLRSGFQLVGIGHVLLIAYTVPFILLDIDWAIPARGRAAAATKEGEAARSSAGFGRS